jgi:glycerophosphoryl diester phosphodiesterase
MDAQPREGGQAMGDGAYRPLVVAHRGASAEAPEHTLAAYLRAIEQGADGVECDVRLTRDGHLVCVHDRRLERTSDGRGVVSDYTLEELAGLDFGSWHPGLPDSADDLVLGKETRTDLPVLTFGTLLRTVLEAPYPVHLLVETKHPTRYGGLVEEALAAVLRRYGLTEPRPQDQNRVTMMSFSLRAVRRMRELAPALPTVLLMESVPSGLRDGGLPDGVTVAGPGLDVLRRHPRYVRRVHDRGGKVYVWTVNEPDEVELVLDLRVDGIITDRPRRVLDRLASAG